MQNLLNACISHFVLTPGLEKVPHQRTRCVGNGRPSREMRWKKKRKGKGKKKGERKEKKRGKRKEKKEGRKKKKEGRKKEKEEKKRKGGNGIYGMKRR